MQLLNIWLAHRMCNVCSCCSPSLLIVTPHITPQKELGKPAWVPCGLAEGTGMGQRPSVLCFWGALLAQTLLGTGGLNLFCSTELPHGKAPPRTG